MRIDQRLGAGTTGGTLLSIIGQLGLHDMVKTAVLAPSAQWSALRSAG